MSQSAKGTTQTAAQPSYPGTPRWAKVLGIILAIVILLFVVLLLTRGPHGPRRHTSFQSTIEFQNLGVTEEDRRALTLLREVPRGRVTINRA
jgi:hypothetical protein